jgi:predicted helicase
LAPANLSEMNFQRLAPNDRGDWLNIGSAAFEEFLPVADKRTKLAPSRQGESAIFKLFSLGIVTNRDDWLYGRTGRVEPKARYFIEIYESERVRLRSAPRGASIADLVDRTIKWTSELEAYLTKRRELHFDVRHLVPSLYRPYTMRETYFAPALTHRPYQQEALFPDNEHQNVAIAFGFEERVEFAALATNALPNKDMFLPSAAQVLARYRYTKSGERIDDITDWAFNKFVARYGKKGLTKDAIFHFVYAVLHDPIYRETYALNLKREFPRIPFYPDFARWASWGEALMAKHIGYETVDPWPVERIDTPAKRADGTHPKPVLRSHPEEGLVIVDADTQISGIPSEAWSYRLGNRSAIDWVLDQHKEKRPRDPTIAAKFNTYRFADYKESMIELLTKVVRVSVETVAITEAMRSLRRENKA